ncbi:hypothetical protein GCM10011515_07210 [Tsuneonella deserti]|uniref:DUF3617 domain-containing protein n=1 Tax=Tsuneonella deserti TaxID=2035528 RepID=A0ABQ1S3X9_9SPHN|nr:DUF3617 domain-containing protein [Tsuneonella deserti]GGD90159.1 hypothetical protein GCM10011515_07210 [Tsuneonella deserti]
MNHLPLASVLLATFALAGCGGKEAKEPVSKERIIAEAGELARPLPGQYETSVKLLSFSVPGLSEEQADKVKGMMGDVGGKSSGYCLTPDEAKKGFEESVRKMSQGQGGVNCEFSRFDVDGGKLSAEMTCKGPQGMESMMKIDGTATAQSTAMHMAMTQKTSMIPGGEMRMEMQMDSRRTGDCSS